MPRDPSGTLPTRAAAAANPRHRAIIEENRTHIDGITAFINLANDKSCSLSRPSCRTHRIQFNDGPGYKVCKRLQDRRVDSFFAVPSDQPFVANVTGSGDPFGSRIFRDFLFDLNRAKFQRMQVDLQTNGVLFTEKTWGNLRKIHGAIGTVRVSFDAGSEATDAITRRGGDWRQLLENMEFLAGRRRAGEIGELILYFVVQKANFREMADFARPGKRFGVDRIFYSRAINWGTWGAAEYDDQCVCNPRPPLHAEFTRAMADPILADPAVFLGNLADARRAALGHVVDAPLPAN